MQRSTGRKTLRDAAALLSIPAAYAVLYAAGITCPIKFVTGVSCAGCGMTRAWLSVLRLDFRQAFAYHPLFWTVPIAAAIYLLRGRMGRKLYRALTGGLIVAFLLVYLYRMIFGDGDVVVFHPEENLLFRVIRSIGTMFSSAG